MTKTNFSDQDFVAYCSTLLRDHGSPLHFDMPEDEFDCCVRELGSVIWKYAIEKAKDVCKDSVYRYDLNNIKNPFSEA